MLKIKRVYDETELKRYVTTYKDVSGYNLGLDFLKTAQVYALYQGKRILAGFVLNTTLPLRYVTYIPEEKRNHPFLASNMDDIVEITCLFMEKSLSTASRIRVYVACYFYSLMTGKKYFLSGTSTKKLYEMFKSSYPNLIFEGKEAVNEIGKGDYLWVSYGKRMDYSFGIVREIFKRVKFLLGL